MDQVATRKRRCRSASEWRSIMARQEVSGLSGEGLLRGGRHRQERVLALAPASVGRGRGGRRRRSGVRRAVRGGARVVGRGAGTRRRRGAAGASTGVLIPAAERRIWLCVAPTDIRRSFDGLAALARNHLGEDPADGSWFVYVNRRRTIVKVLSFDGSGYWVWSKRLEVGRFAVPDGRGVRSPGAVP